MRGYNRAFLAGVSAMNLTLRFAFGLTILTLSGGRAQALDDKPAAPVPRSHALLVGCTRYPALAERYQLDGPGNDVLLMADFLHSRFRFPRENIVLLSEKAGADRGPKYLPTRANIEREFGELAKKALAGDRVVILLAGHGSRQPDRNVDDPEHFKPDGLAEIFLPRDIGEWEDRQGSVKNAIEDNEFRIWLKKIRAKKASVWVIVDACHAASMMRGTEDEKTREVPAEKLVPRAVLGKAEERARKVDTEKGRGSQAGSPFKLPPAEPDLVAIYAAQSTEPTVERTMPMEGKDRKPYGLLTFTICQILTQAKTPLTYTELVQRIHAQYLAWGRFGPTPLVEGKDRSREILGDKEHRGRSRILLAKDEKGGWKVNAGTLQGLTAGTILAVKPPAGAANINKVLGHLVVTEDGLATLDARVEPCAYRSAAKPGPNDLVQGARCEVVFVNYGDRRVKLAVDPLTDKQEKVPAAVLQKLASALEAIAGEENSNVQAVASPRDGAKWLLRIDSLKSGKVYLVPASGWCPPGGAGKPGKGTEPPPLFGPVPEGDRRISWLRESLSKIGRVQGLLALAGSQGDDLARDEDAVKVQVDIVRLKDKSNRKGEIIPCRSGGITLHAGEWIGLRVSNKSKEPIDINLLVIDGSYGISAIYPKGRDVLNRIRPGNKIQVRTRMTGDTPGLEHLVVIAVKPRQLDQYANFTFLAQPSIERVRGFGSLDSPLGRLLQTAVYAQGKTRGMSTESIDDHAFELLSWQYSPKKRAAAQPK
jgi:hypothetical protein